MTSERELITNRTLREEYGFPKETAYEIMRQVGVIKLPGVHRLYVRRVDLDAFLDAAAERAEKPYDERAEGEGPC